MAEKTKAEVTKLSERELLQKMISETKKALEAALAKLVSSTQIISEPLMFCIFVFEQGC